MAVRKNTVECFDENTDEDCDPKNEAVRPVKTLTEMWRFDGQRYVRRVERARANDASTRSTLGSTYEAARPNVIEP